MPLLKDFQESSIRVRDYAFRLAEIIRRRLPEGGKPDLKDIAVTLRHPDVIEEGKQVFLDFCEKEGAKASLATVATIVGLSLGSIGVAGFGSAVGISLVAVMLPVGLLVGNECDSQGWTRSFSRRIANAAKAFMARPRS